MKVRRHDFVAAEDSDPQLFAFALLQTDTLFRCTIHHGARARAAGESVQRHPKHLAATTEAVQRQTVTAMCSALHLAGSGHLLVSEVPDILLS